MLNLVASKQNPNRTCRCQVATQRGCRPGPGAKCRWITTNGLPWWTAWKKTGSCGCSKINENHRFWLIHIHPHLDVSNRKFNRIHRFTQANMKSSPATNWDLTIPKAQMRNSPLVSDPPSLASTFSMQRWLSGLCHQCGGDPRSSTSKAFNKLLLSIFGWGYDVYG